MITIDGSYGEGGGQVLRTSLALSLTTGMSFRIKNIRAGRKKPGLLRQHLTAVNAAAEIGQARVDGAVLGSKELSFEPGEIAPGEYRFAVGTAGSATLVLQTILPALLTATGQSKLILEGGTHNPYAPPFEFLQRVLLPIINRMGPTVIADLERPGFYPAGGGRFNVEIAPCSNLRRIDITERGEVHRCSARALVAKLPAHIGARELKVIERELGWAEEHLKVEEVTSSYGPGNALMIEIECDNITEVFTAFGERGVRAEDVAGKAVEQVRQYLQASVPVGPHLADQLLLPFALAGGGSFRTLPLSNHARTNLDVLGKFLDLDMKTEQQGKEEWLVELG